MLKKEQLKKFLWIIPAIVAFLIALIPTLTYQWPLTLDIYYHVHIAQVYSHYGLTFIDPLINPPNGSPIAYPPLFSLLIVLIGSIFKINYLTVGRYLQPFLALLVVLSVSYVAKKFYGDISGMSAGFLILSSYLFSRLVSPLPETMALIFVPLIVYLYYKSIISKDYKFALLSSFLFLVVILSHQATTLLVFLIITSITIVVGILMKEKRFLISYSLFLSFPLILGIILSIIALIIAPNYVNKILTYGISAVTGYTVSLPINDPISGFKYVSYLGIVLIFAIIGAVVAIKRRTMKDLFIFVWIIVIFFISNSYWFGINVYTIRLLVHLLIPLSILGGMGLNYIYMDYKKADFPNTYIRSVFLIIILIISTLFAVSIVTSPNFNELPKYNSQPYGLNTLIIPQIAPPTNSDIELANWLNQNGNKKLALVSNNYYTDQFLLATTGQPIADVTSSEHVIEWGFSKTELTQKNIGYYVYDKRLNFSGNPSQKIISEGTFIFYNNNDNITSLLPNNTLLVYENKDYKVFEI